MTTITIDRALLEQALSALLLPCDRWNGVQYRIVKDAAEALLNALAAPATAPEPLKARPDFIAGYDAGMADAKRMQMVAALECQRQLVDVQVRSAPATAPEPICTKCGDVITAHDPGLCGCCLSTRDTTTPVQPSWHDAPTKPGNWWGKSKANGKHKMFVEITQREIGSRPPWFPEYRWFGPIPEDKP